jgi:hypothetical protein
MKYVICWYFLNFLLSSRIVSEAWVVVCISELVLVQRMHTTSPVLGTGVALRIHRVAHCAPFSGPLFIICFLTIPTHHFVCNYQPADKCRLNCVMFGGNVE